MYENYAILIFSCCLKTSRFLAIYAFSLIQTERAAERVKELLEGEGALGALGIRLGVKRRE
jgi:hypothetical protein